MFYCFLRFLFLLLGPAGKAPQYHEIGRSIATLMTDEVTDVPFEVDADYDAYNMLNYSSLFFIGKPKRLSLMSLLFYISCSLFS